MQQRAEARRGAHALDDLRPRRALGLGTPRARARARDDLEQRRHLLTAEPLAAAVVPVEAGAHPALAVRAAPPALRAARAAAPHDLEPRVGLDLVVERRRILNFGAA